jgi:lipoyl(octanoyl) transferase
MDIRFLGLIDYEEAWALQKELASARSRNEIPDTLLLLEHPHTYTLGSSGKPEHLLMRQEDQDALGVTVLKVDRGGDITYHGPGQLVGYPIFQLPRQPGSLHADVVQYIRDLEAALIIALEEFNIPAGRLEGLTGVWVEGEDQLEKIAAIGVKVTSRAITQHGFALNVHPDLSFFQGIVPCGIPDKPVTSMERLLGYAPDFEQVIEAVIGGMLAVFEN